MDEDPDLAFHRSRECLWFRRIPYSMGRQDSGESILDELDAVQKLGEQVLSTVVTDAVLLMNDTSPGRDVDRLRGEREDVRDSQ